MTKDFVLKELAYFRSQCVQERRELEKAIKENDWRMKQLAENNLKEAQRQFEYFRNLLASHAYSYW